MTRRSPYATEVRSLDVSICSRVGHGVGAEAGWSQWINSPERTGP